MRLVRRAATGTVTLGFIPRTSAIAEIEYVGYERQAIAVSLTLSDTVPLTVILRRPRAPR